MQSNIRGTGRFRRIPLAVFTLEDVQIVWTDKSPQTDKSSDVKMGGRNFQMTQCLNLSVCENDFLKTVSVRRDEQVDQSPT